jgi:hypothetical protein
VTPQPLPTDFVLSHVPLTWGESLWGYEHQWIDWSCLSELAVGHIDTPNQSKPEEVQLGGMVASESAGALELVRKLAESEPAAPEEAVQRKWLYLVLLWIYENRERFSDPLALVEEVFCDFGRPLEITSFIRYMPPADGYDPRHHSKAENESRMLQHWRDYLTLAASQFGLAHARHS